MKSWFSEEFVAQLEEEEAVVAAKKICDLFFEEISSIQWDEYAYSFEEHIDAFALLSRFLERSGLVVEMPVLPEERHEIISAIQQWFRSVQEQMEKKESQLLIESAMKKYVSRFEVGFLYEFSEGDLKRVQQLISELRNELVQNKLFEEDHRARLLKRLEKLQSELHKKVSDLDRFWGMVGDMGVVLGKFGNDAKPIVDRLREIAGIVWRTQSRAEELPSDTTSPLLSDKSSE